MKATWIALAAAAMLTACGAVHGAGSDQAIPWLALEADIKAPPAPTPQPMPVPNGTPPCSAAQLRAGVIGDQGATGHVETSFGFSGSAAGPCYVNGTPSVTLLDAAGRNLGFKQHAPYFPNEVIGPALVEPGPPPEPHTGLKLGIAALTIDWVSQPEACPGQDGAVVAKARIEVGGGSITIAIPIAPAGYACQGVGVGSFEGPAIPVQVSPPPPLPAIAISAPGSTKAGSRFEYVVTLTNGKRAPMDLAAGCPNYEEEMFGPDGYPLGGKHLFKLNCAPAGTLQPGQSAKFQMIFTVPKDAAAGVYNLTFMLGYWNAMTTFTDQVPVQVTA